LFHAWQVLDVLGDMFVHIFKGLQHRFAKDIEIVNKQFPREPFKFLEPTCAFVGFLLLSLALWKGINRRDAAFLK
jgi:hypothetical protein